jgi:uncharacterized membrane protein YgcG
MGSHALPGVGVVLRPFLLTLLVLVQFVTAALAQSTGGERILSFHSEVTVKPDSSLVVTETIRVRAQGKKIRRGIYRDFPTKYKDRQGRKYRVGFTVLNVKRDGSPEAWHQKSQGNGVRVYIGKKDRFLPQGEYTYALTYQTTRQLGFFEEHDELYWNVTGNGWDFPIDEATCTVTLPAGVPSGEFRLDGYTGVFGSQEQAVEIAAGEDGRARFRATRPMAMREGLTVVVGWPKGFVEKPGRLQGLLAILAPGKELRTGGLGLLVLLGYYLLAWAKVGRDPPKGVVVPRFEPPGRLSPAAMRYIRRMGFDTKAFAAAVIDMAVRGYLEIREEGKKFTLEKRVGGDPEALTKRQRGLAGKLFPGSGTSLTLAKSNHQTVGGALKDLKKSLEGEFNSVAFHLNSKYLLAGMLLTIVTLGFMTLQGGGLPSPFLLIWVTVWTAAVVALWAQRVFLMAVIFTACDVLVLVKGLALSWTSALAFLVLIAVNVLFFFLLRRPTSLGTRLMNEIEGFRMYLSAAEGNRLQVMNPPERTPKLFEKYLPYALALDVDQEWAEQFASLLAQAATEQASGGYHPSWYHGSRWSGGNLGGMTHGLTSSLTSAISSSSTAPGSSSGGGGGGSSGGGGGGGGGGGW